MEEITEVAEDNLLKCRALFLYSTMTLISMQDKYAIGSDNYLELLKNFFMDYVLVYPELFKLAYSFEYNMENGEMIIYEKENWNDLAYKYCQFLADDVNDRQILKIYNDIGYENVAKISKLSEIFYAYVVECYGEDDNYIKIKQ